MPSSSTAPPAWLSTWMSAGAALFFLLMLSVPSGYSIGGGVLLLGGLAVWWTARRAGRGIQAGGPDGLAPAPWTAEDRTLCALLLAVFAINVLAVLWHGDSGKYLDQGARYLLAVPILAGLRRIRLRLGWVAAGLALGLFATAGVAAWQTLGIGYERATGFVTSAIPFADMALTMGFWSLMGAALAAIQRRWAWSALLLAGALAGLYAMIAAATRGSLVALPVLLVLAAVALLRRAHLRPLLAGIALLAAAAAIALAVLPAGQIAESRYAAALDEWRAYSQQGDASNNVGSRLEAWKAALISIPERPLLGWGHAQYDAHLQTLIEAERVAPFVGTLSNTHNQFIEIWLHQGSLGLIAFLALLIASFWYFCRRLRAPEPAVRVLACCGAALPAAFAAYGLTQVILGRNNGVMFFLVSLAVLWAALRQAERDAAQAAA
ncbi:O-antigen ligase family protein [Castellaniella ginsengisoli]|uniref:O-antigen ligase family protein n=1 Tax=Castellaniella ginsengisoli TaxID=546114 RepID=A0AB39D620_9BURK